MGVPDAVVQVFSRYRLACVEATLEAAEQRVRYVGKHNYDHQEEGPYRDGFEIACEVCEISIGEIEPASVEVRF